MNAESGLLPVLSLWTLHYFVLIPKRCSMVHKMQFLYSAKTKETCAHFDAYRVCMLQIYCTDSTNYIGWSSFDNCTDYKEH